jgi:hypothetical protein
LEKKNKKGDILFAFFELVSFLKKTNGSYVISHNPPLLCAIIDEDIWTGNRLQNLFEKKATGYFETKTPNFLLGYAIFFLIQWMPLNVITDNGTNRLMESNFNGHIY